LAVGKKQKDGIRKNEKPSTNFQTEFQGLYERFIK